MHHNKHKGEPAERVASLLTIGGRNNENEASLVPTERSLESQRAICWPRFAPNMSPQYCLTVPSHKVELRIKRSPKAAICYVLK
jgi:hypothetical protein